MPLNAGTRVRADFDPDLKFWFNFLTADRDAGFKLDGVQLIVTNAGLSYSQIRLHPHIQDGRHQHR